jgi:hypothetical protein
MRQLLDLGREHAALRQELTRLSRALTALQRFLAAGSRKGKEHTPAATAAGGPATMTIREQETLLRALDLWRTAVGQMTWEERAEASLSLLVVRDDELEELRRRIQRGEIR